MKKLQKKQKLAALIAAGSIVVTGGTVLTVQALQPDSEPVVWGTVLPEEGGNREATHIPAKDVVTIETAKPGKGIKGDEDKDKVLNEDQFITLRLPFVDTPSVKPGGGFMLSADTFAKDSEPSARIYPSNAKKSDEAAFKAEVDDATEYDSIIKKVTIPTNLSNGKYVMEVKDKKNTYKLTFDVVSGQGAAGENTDSKDK